MLIVCSFVHSLHVVFWNTAKTYDMVNLVYFSSSVFIYIFYIHISFKLSFCCLEVVCVGIYFDLPNGGVLPSYCLSTKGVLSYLKPLYTLNTFVETFFSPDIFGLIFQRKATRLNTRLTNITVFLQVIITLASFIWISSTIWLPLHILFIYLVPL